MIKQYKNKKTDNYINVIFKIYLLKYGWMQNKVHLIIYQ